MSVQTGPLQIRRLTSSQLSAIIPASGEPIKNTTTGALVLGDGVTVGGVSPTITNANLFALSNLTGAADTGFYFTGSSTMSLYTLSALGRTLGGIANQAAGRTAIGAAASGANTDIISITGSAATLTTTRSIALSGDATWSVNFNGSANATAALTLATTGVAAGTYNSVTVDTKGRVTAGVADTAFVATPLNNSWTVQSSRRSVYRKTVDCVQLEVNITGGTATDGTTVITLPVGFRPASEFTIPVRSNPAVTPTSSVVVPSVVVRTDGTIGCVNCTAAGGINFVCSFSTI